MSGGNGRVTRPPSEPALLGALVDEACASLRTAVATTPRMTAPLPHLLSTLAALTGVIEQAPHLVRFLRRQAENTAWLHDERNITVATTVAHVANALDAAVAALDIAHAALTEATEQTSHLGRSVDLAGYGRYPFTTGPADHPVYDLRAVPVGPFDVEPFELDRLLDYRPDGSYRLPHHHDACAAQWLVDALRAGDVALGAHDVFTAFLLAAHSPATAQVVAGWIARAHRAREPTHEPVPPITEESPPADG